MVSQEDEIPEQKHARIPFETLHYIQKLVVLSRVIVKLRLDIVDEGNGVCFLEHGGWQRLLYGRHWLADKSHRRFRFLWDSDRTRQIVRIRFRYVAPNIAVRDTAE